MASRDVGYFLGLMNFGYSAETHSYILRPLLSNGLVYT